MFWNNDVKTCLSELDVQFWKEKVKLIFPIYLRPGEDEIPDFWVTMIITGFAWEESLVLLLRKPGEWILYTCYEPGGEIGKGHDEENQDID